MQVIVDIVLPLFGVLALGYAAARLGVFDEAANRGLALFVFMFAMPMLLFRAIASAELPEQVPWGFMLLYYGGTFIVFAAAMLAGRLVFARHLDEQGVLGLGAGFSNTAMLGIPLTLTAYGPPAALPLFMLLAVHGLIMLTTTTAIVEAGRGSPDRVGQVALSLLRGLATNPIIWGVSAGLACNLLGLRIPGALDAVAQALGAAAAPCALFALGASLTRYGIAKELAEPVMLVALKTTLHPALVWLLATQLFHLPGLWTAVAVTLAALPTGINAYLFAQRYQVCVATSATAILLATGLSALSLSALVIWFSGT